LYSVVEIRFAIDDDGVFASHFRDDALNPELTLLRLRCQLVDTQTDIARSSKRNETGFRMRDQSIADGAARAGKLVNALGGESGFVLRFS
jgi:hypothetical protein